MRLFRRGGPSGPGGHGVPGDVLARAGLRQNERVLASTAGADGSWVLGTRRLLVLVGPGPASEPRPASDPHPATRQIPWEQVEGATWDQDSSKLQVTEIGSYGEQRPAYSLELDDPALLLQLVRERVTASIVLQRRFPVRGSIGLRVIGRRSPGGGPVTWMHDYDPGLNPDDPEVALVAEQALTAARADVGDFDPIGGDGP